MEHVIQKKDIGLTAKKKSFFWSPVPLEVAKNPDTIFFSMKTVFFVWFKKLFNHIKCVESVAKCFSTDQKSHNIITFIAPQRYPMIGKKYPAPPS